MDGRFDGLTKKQQGSGMTWRLNKTEVIWVGPRSSIRGKGEIETLRAIFHVTLLFPVFKP